MPAIIAVVAGALLAIVALVPWVAVQYRRRGSLGLGPTVIAVGTLVYAFAIVTYTLLPLLSDVTALCAAGGSGRQWHPGRFLRDIADNGGWTLHNPAVLQFGFNVLLFIPLGMIVRYALLRRRGVFAGVLGATVAGLLVSLLVETTQLTGNWFLYPCSYRVFDVDDLIANSAGALLGGIVAPLLALVPGQRQERPADEPRRLTGSRRLLGMLCDVLTVGLIGVVAGVTVNAVAMARGVDVLATGVHQAQGIVGFLPALVELIVVLTTGRTVGEAAVRLGPARRPNVTQRTVRWALGVGGWSMLTQVDSGWSGAASIGLVLISLLAVWTTREHRGFAAWVSRIEIADDRSRRPRPGPRSEPTTATS